MGGETAVAPAKDQDSASVSKASALAAITKAIEAAPFPALAADWEEVEMCCVAMNDHYVEHMQCPREMLMNRNNRVLDPTHYTSLPGKVRLGIRSAMSYGHNFDACFESVKTADRGHHFMKAVSMRTVVLGRHRFIVGWQHTRGDDAYGKDVGWWQVMEELVAGAANNVDLLARWISPTEAADWDGCEQGRFVQTETLCRKEQLDEALVRAVTGLPFPVLVCDPFLPECPVIGLSATARALTGWGELEQAVTDADRRLLEGAVGAARGAYHVNYGIYGTEDEERRERLAVRAACSNGRPCPARFRRMHEPLDKEPCSMWLQGVTLAQGVNAGPLSGCDVWYLVGLLSEEAVPERWSRSVAWQQGMSVLRSAVAQAVEPVALAGLADGPGSQHPYGGDVKLLQLPLWHGRAQ